MFRRILLPVDLSDRHAAALRVAVELCQASQGEIRLLHVTELIPGLEVEEERPFYDRLEKAAQEHLDRLGKQLDEAQVRYQVDIRLGRRVAEIAAVAREMAADLVVLTRPRPDPEVPLAGLGSLSFRAALVAPCPVLLVH